MPKLGALLLLKRLLVVAPASDWLMEVVLVLGMGTIILGTLGALRQSNTRRMISFGSIAHSGFLLGLVAVDYPDAFWFYGVVYGIMNLGVFYLVDRYEGQEVFLHKQYAFTSNELVVGGAFTLMLVSLVGLPPLAGFTAKLFFFSSLWEVYTQPGQVVYLAFLFI